MNTLDNIIAGKPANEAESIRIAKAETLKQALTDLENIQTRINNGDVIEVYNLQYNSLIDEFCMMTKFTGEAELKICYAPYGGIINACVLNDITIINADIQLIIDEL